MSRNSLLLILTSVMATLLVVFLLLLPAILHMSPVLFLKLMTNQELPVLVAKVVVESKKQAFRESQKQNPVAITALEKSSTILPEKQQVFSLVIAPGHSQSLKLFMEQDYDLSYRWSTDGQIVYAKLTGQPQSVTAPNEKVFGAIASDKANGFFIPPFTGTYVWCWKNKTKQPVTLHFTGKGAFKRMG